MRKVNTYMCTMHRHILHFTFYYTQHTLLYMIAVHHLAHIWTFLDEKLVHGKMGKTQNEMFLSKQMPIQISPYELVCVCQSKKK